MKKILFALTIGFALLFSSCSADWLDLNPYAQQSDETAISSMIDAKMAVHAGLAKIRSVSFYGREAVACGDAGTPDVVQKIPNSNRYGNVYLWNNIQPGGGHFSSIFAMAYNTIDAMNKVMVGIGKLEVHEKDKLELDHYLGEAYFFRALAHFEVLKYFSQAYNFTSDASHLGAMYILEPTTSNSHKRETVAQTFEFIIKDCEKALELMKPELDYATPFYVNSSAVNALLARVYLYRACKDRAADFTKAKEYAEAVINTNKYKLATADEYKIENGESESFVSKMWQPVGGFSSETILGLPSSETERNYTDALSKIYLDNVKGYGDLLPSSEIVKLITSDPNDVRASIFYKHEDFYCMRKFFGEDAKNWDLYTFNVFRISEMYLIAAEGAARGSNVDETLAKKYLNELKVNRGLTAKELLTGQALIDEILLERRKELCFEGHRLADLKRLNLPIVRGVDPLNPNNDKEQAQLAYPDYRFAYPVPQHEQTVNTELEQNPGYSSN